MTLGIDEVDYLGNFPTLGGKEISYSLGTCGSFGWLIEFLYNPRYRETGIILQEVKIDIKYQEYDEFGQLQKKVHHVGPKINPYHEIWDASTYATDNFNPEDAFHWRMTLDSGRRFHDQGGVPNSVGTATITGYARYYPNLSFEDKSSEFDLLGWKKPNPDTWARDLWSGEKNPGWLAAGATASSLFVRSISVKWNCCLESNSTELVSKSPL